MLFIRKKLHFRRRLYHKQRWKKKFKRHAENFFLSRLKKYKYYYKKNRKNKKIDYKLWNTQLSKRFTFGIRALHNKIIDSNQLIALLKLLKRYSRMNNIEKLIYFRIAAFPDFYLTSRAKSVRMGKGKGAISKKVFFLKKNKILLELRKWNSTTRRKKYILSRKIFFFLYFRLFCLLLRAKYRLSSKNLVIRRFW